MLRKLGIALVAAASLGASALAPSPASAHVWHGGWPGGWHGGWHRAGWGWGPGFYPAYPYYGYGGCWVRRLAPVPWGPRGRAVNHCY